MFSQALPVRSVRVISFPSCSFQTGTKKKLRSRLEMLRLQLRWHWQSLVAAFNLGKPENSGTGIPWQLPSYLQNGPMNQHYTWPSCRRWASKSYWAAWLTFPSTAGFVQNPALIWWVRCETGKWMKNKALPCQTTPKVLPTTYLNPNDQASKYMPGNHQASGL